MILKEAWQKVIINEMCFCYNYVKLRIEGKMEEGL